MAMSVQEIIQGLNTKNKAVLDPLFSMYGKRLYDKAAASLLSPQSARQAVCEAFLYVFRHGAEIGSEEELVQALESTVDKACVKKLLDASPEEKNEVSPETGEGETQAGFECTGQQAEKELEQKSTDFISMDKKNAASFPVSIGLGLTVALLVYVLIAFNVI